MCELSKGTGFVGDVVECKGKGFRINERVCVRVYSEGDDDLSGRSWGRHRYQT